MSRIAKMGVSVPAGVDVKIGDEQITVKGSGGELKLAANPLVKVSADGANLSFAPVGESREANAMSGTMRQLVNNMVV
ncbi:MAG: 50S ribosomal protein L6, partial [Caldilineaceae bacterium]